MATQAEDLMDEHDQTPPHEDDGGDGHEPVKQGSDDANQPGSDEDGDEEVDVVGWGEKPVDAAEESEGVRNLRAALKREKDRNRELEAKQAPKVDEVGEKPNLDDYWERDEGEYDRDYEAWLERKRVAKEREETQQAAARRQAEKWQVQSQSLNDGYTELRAPAKDAARSTVEDQFPGEQFAYLVKAAGNNAPAFIYALGNSDEKRAELRALADEGSWAEFIAAAAVMAKEVNVQRRKPATTPEKQHRGGGVSTRDTTLERLERDASKTGDRTELIAYRRKLRDRETARG